LEAKAAWLPGWTRVFADMSPQHKWHGAVASIKEMEGETVYGSIVNLTKEEMLLLDPYETCNSEDPTSSDPKVN
jgi:hypothetical protein